MLKSKILYNLQVRGFINDCTDINDLDEKLLKSKITAYIGYDATASSLHVGHLVNIMMLRWFQAEGNQVITLLGGGTTKVGDPSFRNAQRPMIDDKIINSNIDSLKKIFSKYLTFSANFPGALMLNNNDWLTKLNYLNFLRDIGKHFSINKMLSFDSIKTRLEKNDPLSFLEFNYMILQGYDFYKLHEDYDCILQMGGSDQWGNIVNGIDLTRRITGKKVFGLTSPLLTNAAGEKMGKSVNGAIWLNEENLSPYEFWQFWRNCEDHDIKRFLLLFTELPIDVIGELTGKKGHHLNEAKIVLANEVTSLCHGKDKTADAFKASLAVFSNKIGSDKLPKVVLRKEKFGVNISVIQLLTSSGLVRSGKEARRLIRDNAIRVDGNTVNAITDTFKTEDFIKSKKLSVGKKKHYNIEIE